jgi:hypothetical protein
MSSKYVPPSKRIIPELTPKPILVVVEPSAQIKSSYVPPNKRSMNPIGPISAIISAASFPSLGSSNSSPSAIAPTMNYLKKIRDAEAARTDDDDSNEALERDGWLILNLSFSDVKGRLASWYDTVFYKENLPY